jgi:hypothetical protein
VSDPARFGRFILRRRLGAGGYGIVFDAEDTSLGATSPSRS